MKILFLVACALSLFLIEIPRAHSQAEIDPDHYEATGSQSHPPRGATNLQLSRVHYRGNVTLEHNIQCSGKNLLPGAYVVSLDSEGGKVTVTLNREHQAVKIDGIPERRAGYLGQDSLVVVRRGTTRQLSAIHTARLDLVFGPGQKPEQARFDRDQDIERLPVVAAEYK